MSFPLTIPFTNWSNYVTQAISTTKTNATKTNTANEETPVTETPVTETPVTDTQAINAVEETTMTETTMTETTMTETQAKATKPVTTAKYARHLLALQEARVKRLEEELLEARIRVDELDNLAATLPETATTTSGNVKQYAVGDGVSFRFGRAEKARTMEGSIVAVKTEDGKAVQYRVAVGEGFDQELFTVFPGQIIASAKEDESTNESTNEAAI